ncbi:helix-turn-helix domain-containing protein [Streptomyces sp. AD2-2]|nr:helix-turn-helix domain-containing protein [Streptomyces sp. AD2-2]
MVIEHDGFGAELRRRRIAAGMSLSELAGKVYCSRSFLSRVENGRRRASLELAQLCDEVLDAKGALVGLAPLPGTDAVPKAVRGGAGSGPPGRSGRRRRRTGGTTTSSSAGCCGAVTSATPRARCARPNGTTRPPTAAPRVIRGRRPRP